MRPLLWPLLLCFALAACMGSEQADSIGGASRSASGGLAGSESMLAAASFANMPLGAGCAWGVASDPDKINLAFPDSAAKYWVSMAPITPGTRLKIQGHYPKARYFSFNAYDLAQRPTDALADVELSPDDGTGASYTAYLAYGESPTQNPEVSRAANTFYSGQVQFGPSGLPNAGMVLLMYRVYLSDQGEFFDGGAGLPKLTLETADGSRELASLPNCAEPLLPNFGGALPNLGLNERLLGLDYPDALTLDFPTATYPPRTNKFYGLGEVVSQIIEGRTGASVPGNQNVSLGEGGFLSNIHNAYTTSTFARRYGNIAMVRAKAPTYKGQAGVPVGQENLRYWSLCGNEFATQRFTACAADFQVPVDDEGYFTVVLSDPADRPANATAENGFLWLPWGPYPDQVLIYRHMLENPAFAQAIQRVEKGTPLADVMGEFTPVNTYCKQGVFVQSNAPRQVFDLCLTDQTRNPPPLVTQR